MTILDAVSDVPQDKDNIKATLISFAYELGISIVAPLIIFAALGIWFDKHFDTKPAGTIVSLLLSLIPTTISIAKKVKKFNP